jgi:hypothetical protein
MGTSTGLYADSDAAHPTVAHSTSSSSSRVLTRNHPPIDAEGSWHWKMIQGQHNNK